MPCTARIYVLKNETLKVCYKKIMINQLPRLHKKHIKLWEVSLSSKLLSLLLLFSTALHAASSSCEAPWQDSWAIRMCWSDSIPSRHSSRCTSFHSTSSRVLRRANVFSPLWPVGKNELFIHTTESPSTYHVYWLYTGKVPTRVLHNCIHWFNLD